MIVENGKYYLYRHLRNDTGIPVYIGIGQKEGVNRTKITSEYRRAYASARNPLWNNIKGKHGIEVEILLESDDKDFIKRKEIEFVTYYGRLDIGTGTLCNMTNGGDYFPLKNKKTSKGNGLSFSERQVLSRKMLSNRNPLGTRSKKMWVYDGNTGVLVKKYEQQLLCAKDFNVHTVTIWNAIKAKRKLDGYIFSHFDFGDRINTANYKEQRRKEVPVCKIDPNTLQEIDKFRNMTLGAKSVGATVANLFSSIQMNIICSGYYWKIDDGKPFVLIPKKRRGINKKHRKT